ncbi:MAG: transposase family protein [Opitutales bacterium]
MAQRQKRVASRRYGIGDLREHLLLLLMYYRTYTTHLFLAQIFKVDEKCETVPEIRFSRFARSC